MEIHEIFQTLTKRKYNFLTKRGNDSIEKALKIVKKLGYKDIYIADQGGWISYKISSNRLKLNLHEIKSSQGIISPGQTAEIKDSVFLLNSMPAYIAYQPMEMIKEQSKQNNNIIIEDITATIGEETYGDILVCSFAKTKPVNHGKLGLISFDEERFNVIEFNEPEYEEELLKSLNKIDKRKKLLKKNAKKVKKDLDKFDIIHKQQEGMNVIVRFENEKEKEDIEKYCKENFLEFVECPKYIKVLDTAISIEIKKSF